MKKLPVPAAVPFLLILLLAPRVRAQAARGSATGDIVLGNVAGDLVRENTKGGFEAGRVKGKVDVTANGSIKLGRVDGSVNAVSNVGDIEIASAAGAVSVRAQAGNISIGAAGGAAFAQAEMGEIRIRAARSVEIRNIFGGDVKIAGVTGLTQVVTKGNILLVAGPAAPGSVLCDLSSTEGDITLFLPADLAADLAIRTPFLEDPKRERQIQSEFKFGNFVQRCETGNIITLAAKINGGGARIDLYIEKGNIFIKRLGPGQAVPF